MNKLIALTYCFLLSLGLSAQGESDWWYFGYYAGLHFVDDTVETVYDGELTAAYQSSTVSNENGDLLFYTNGGVVYSNNHEVMENVGDSSSNSSIAAVSMKIGSNDSIYHLFYLDYYYSIVYKTININSNNGLGVVSDPVFFQDSANFHITATKQANGIDYWIVCRKVIGNTYISYSLTEEGLDLENPVYSQAGDDTNPVNGNWSSGHLRINAQGNLIVFSLLDELISTYAQGRCELFYFNKSTGKIEERILKMDDTNIETQNGYHFVTNSAEFSPDGEKLYLIGRWVFQCNIGLLDSTSIIQSVIRFNEFQQSYFLTGSQLAKDGRIYISSLSTSWLSVIHHPNIAGLGAGFSFDGIDVAPSSSSIFLPNFDPSLFSSGFTVANRCVNAETQFSLIYDMDYQYIHWDFGDGTTSTEWEPSHSYSSTGTYIVELTTVLNSDTLIKEMEVIIEGPPTVDLGIDGSLLCEGDSLLLDASFYAGYYKWQDDSYLPTYTVMQEGEYFVEVKNICGVASDTINILLDKDELAIGEDTLICIEKPLVLVANQSSATSWLWQDGSTLPFYEAESEGDYFVIVNTPCYILYDSIHVDTENCSPIIPNIFTPNGDGVNDKFEIQHLNNLGYSWSLEIYNRWGKQVYYSSDYQNEWNGEDLSEGVYFYILRSKSASRSYKGNVTIARE